MNRVDIEKAKEWIKLAFGEVTGDEKCARFDELMKEHKLIKDTLNEALNLRIAKGLKDNYCQTCGTEYEYYHPEQSYVSCFDCGQQLREVGEEVEEEVVHIHKHPIPHISD